MFDTLTRMGAAGAGGTYEIEKSLRFNKADSAYLNMTPPSDGSMTTWTWSGWVKRGLLRQNYNSHHYIFQACPENGHRTALYWMQGDSATASDADCLTFQYYGGSGGTNYHKTTTAKYRDVSGWYHIVAVWDTTNGTAADRMRLWVNGSRITSWVHNIGDPPQNQASHVNDASYVHSIGRRTHNTDNYLDGYLAEVNFVDGQALDASSFGKTNADTGQWIPKKYAGAYGDEGFYLKFDDISGTTATTLGKDSSGNGNNWTPNNFSVATDDEIACDSFSDTPTNNWCTMNPINNPNGATLNNGNLEVNLVYPHDDNGVYATFGVTSGKWYWEAKCTSAGNRGQVGVTDAGHKSGSNSGYNYSVATRHTGGTDDTSGTSNSDLDAVIDSGNWVTFCFDADNGQIWYSREAAPNISGTANVTGLTLGPGRSWQPHIRETGNPVSNFTFNFGASAAGFKYGPPNDDYKALNAANLPEPAILKPTDYFNTVLYTGNNADGNAITGVGFQPNLTYIATRNNNMSKRVYDSVRGVNAALLSDTTADEDQYAGYGQFESFDSDGFTVGVGTNSDGSQGYATNTTGHTYVAWNWKESATAGFDIVTYTGTGSNPQTRAHSLGVAPEMIILKNRSGTNGDEHWAVYHHAHSSTAASSANYWARLNTTGAFENLEMWNDTVPTSSVFTTQNHAISNYNGDTFVAYLFSSVEGYSKVGGYSGNGDANGAFVYLGFKPAFLLIKCTNSAESWEIYDNKRLGYNVNNESLFPDLNNSESSEDRVDLLSNGFKARINSGGLNGSSKDYIYYAIAERSFKYSNAR